MFVICEPGTYQLQTGQGPLSVDPGCGSSHCELLNQTTMATLVVVRLFPSAEQEVQAATSRHKPGSSMAKGCALLAQSCYTKVN